MKTLCTHQHVNHINLSKKKQKKTTTKNIPLYQEQMTIFTKPDVIFKNLKINWYINIVIVTFDEKFQKIKILSSSK